MHDYPAFCACKCVGSRPASDKTRKCGKKHEKEAKNPRSGRISFLREHVQKTVK